MSFNFPLVDLSYQRLTPIDFLVRVHVFFRDFMSVEVEKFVNNDGNEGDIEESMRFKLLSIAKFPNLISNDSKSFQP